MADGWITLGERLNLLFVTESEAYSGFFDYIGLVQK